MARQLAVGDRVELSGGYDMEPAWLCGQPSYQGIVCAFIPGQNTQRAAVVKLDAVLTASGVTGDVVVLELRYAGATWEGTETVHVELCDFVPEAQTWQQRRQDEWVESHATYKRVS